MDDKTPAPDIKGTHDEIDPQFTKDLKDLNFLTVMDIDKKGNTTASAEKEIRVKETEPTAAQTRLNDARANLSDAMSHFKSTDIDGYKKFKSLPNNPDGSYTDKQMEFLKVNAGLAFLPAVEFNDALKNLLAQKDSDKVIESFDKKIPPPEKGETPPNAVERALGRQLLSSLRSGDLADTREMLQNIQKMEAEARTRILNSFASEVAKLPTGGPSMVRWETGKKNNGEEFIRLNININDSNSKSSGGTNITVATDQNPSATYRDRYDSKPVEIDPNSALENSIYRSTKPLIPWLNFDQNQKPVPAQNLEPGLKKPGYKGINR